MSYVDLKHALADLTLEAVANPEGARWVPLLFECAQNPNMTSEGIEWGTLRKAAAQLGENFGWEVSERELQYLERAHLLARHDHHVAVAARFQPHREYMARQTLALLSFLSIYIYHREPPLPTMPRSLWQGVLLFNNGLYFECHELLETAWKQTAGSEKNFLHGLVQLAAAFYHHEKPNPHGFRTLLGKASRRLDPYPSPYMGIELTRLRRSMTRWKEFLATDGGEKAPPIPVIAVAAAGVDNKGTPRG
ncbi:MAG TPA: DUF309 domain-containing protein [bacterium]|jgi:hypothetical protein